MGFNNDFAEWLQNELTIRNWSQADLARASGVSRQAISEALSLRRAPGVIVLKAIGSALKIPNTVIFTKAGLIEKDESSPLLEEIHFKLSALPEDQQLFILDLINSLIAKKQ